MSDYDFDSLGLDEEYQWPVRGRKATPLPEPLVKAVQDSYTNGVSGSIVIKTEATKRFAALLSKIGTQLNFRIERDIEIDKPQKGYSTYHFRARVKNSNKGV